MPQLFIINGVEVEPVTFDPLTQMWCDEYGCVWNLTKEGLVPVDPDERCGVKALSIPKGWKINEFCKVHDRMYSSRVYRTFNTQEVADLALKEAIKLGQYPITARLFYGLVRSFGWLVWKGK